MMVQSYIKAWCEHLVKWPAPADALSTNSTSFLSLRTEYCVWFLRVI